MLRKIVSGGQTGVDRAALDAAIAMDVEHGGWCPKGRLAEDGKIGCEYHLRETDSTEYSERTEHNVIDSDATLILYDQVLSGGTRLTQQFARKHRRANFAVDLSQPIDLNDLINWIDRHNIGVLNVAGPRESGTPGIGDAARMLISDLLVSLKNRLLAND